mmetsp:Transcript_30867/g.78130  ORF Transcript_30867/g.78130 Transcript_30867/m.78130 type:complete len:328 (+) Transcript_30867:318-1301(+)
MRRTPPQRRPRLRPSAYAPPTACATPPGPPRPAPHHLRRKIVARLRIVSRHGIVVGHVHPTRRGIPIVEHALRPHRHSISRFPRSLLQPEPVPHHQVLCRVGELAAPPRHDPVNQPARPVKGRNGLRERQPLGPLIVWPHLLHVEHGVLTQLHGRVRQMQANDVGVVTGDLLHLKRSQVPRGQLVPRKLELEMLGRQQHPVAHLVPHIAAPKLIQPTSLLVLRALQRIATKDVDMLKALRPHIGPGILERLGGLRDQPRRARLIAIRRDERREPFQRFRRGTVDGELRHGEHLRPVLLPHIHVAPQHLLEHAVNTFSLTVGLRMERR